MDLTQAENVGKLIAAKSVAAADAALEGIQACPARISFSSFYLVHWICLFVFDVPDVTFGAEKYVIFFGRVVSHLLSSH